MAPKITYEIFVICPDCEYREHFFSDRKIVARMCPLCGRKLGMGDVPVKSLNYEADEDVRHVSWLRLNYLRNDRLKMDRDAGVTVITHYSK
jgi:hypothetical protein